MRAPSTIFPFSLSVRKISTWPEVVERLSCRSCARARVCTRRGILTSVVRRKRCRSLLHPAASTFDLRVTLIRIVPIINGMLLHLSLSLAISGFRGPHPPPSTRLNWMCSPYRASFPPPPPSYLTCPEGRKKSPRPGGGAENKIAIRNSRRGSSAGSQVRFLDPARLPRHPRLPPRLSPPPIPSRPQSYVPGTRDSESSEDDFRIE